jgi:hypothetical protein
VSLRWFMSALTLVVTACPSSGWAVEAPPAMEVVIEVHGAADIGHPSKTGSARVVFTPVGDGSRKDPRVLVMPTPGRGRIQLDPTRAWTVHLEADGLWAPHRTVQPRTEDLISLDAWPTAQVSGLLFVPPSHLPPAETTLRFGSEEVPETLMRCPVDGDGRWTCSLPATVLDLRLRVPGFVSHYFWGQRLSATRPLALGRQVLVPGASLFGRVTASEAVGGVRGSCLIRLEPIGLVTVAGAEQQRARRLILQTKPNGRGFFHFQGLSPGQYRVIAEQPGAAPAELSPVAVLRQAETEIREPLVLRPPTTLQVSLSPARSPLGDPWRIELWSVSRITHKGELVGSWRASAEGAFERPELPPGEYMIKVQDARRAVLATEVVRLENETHAVDIEIPVVWVEGNVRLGREPVAASVLFGGPFSKEKVELEADEEGEFFGYLPRAGDWLIYVESEDPPVSRYFYDVGVKARGGGVAHVELRLPDTRISGEVVTEDGLPAHPAVVRLYEDDDADETVQYTDPKGGFTFVGVQEGALRIVADNDEASSQQVMVMVQEKLEPPPLRLVLEDERSIFGQVVDPEQRGLPGVPIVAHVASPDGSLVRPGRRVTTDVTGAFELRVPTHASLIQITAFPTGYNLIVLPPREAPRDSLVLQAEPWGGTLVVDLDVPPQWGAHRAPLPVLFADGTPLLFGEVAHWIRLNGGTVGEQTTSLTIPALPAGSYQACLMNVELNSAKRFDVPPDPRRCRPALISPLSTATVSLTSARESPEPRHGRPE